jgi:selenocysteine lyase/cysteine desulfurase
MDTRFERVRRQFPVYKTYVYLNHAAVSPLSTRVVSLIHRQAREQMEAGVVKEDAWEERAEEARCEAARLLGVSPSEIAFVTNTTQGLNLFARGINWKRGDNVVLPRVEFPANVYPWLALEEYGVKVKFVPEREGRILVDDIARKMDSRTRVVAISFVEFASGFRNDLEAIGRLCRDRGVYLVVDAIQGLGALRLDARKCLIDGLSAGGHKWLLAPQGTGIFYCSARVLEELGHPMPGWMSVTGWNDYYDFNYDLYPDSRRYESAQKNLLGIAGLLEALRTINRLGIDDIEARIIGITDHLCGLLAEHGFKVFSPRRDGEKSGIVSFYPQGDADRVQGLLLKKGFVTAARHGRIRVSPHFYNTFQEMERLVRALPGAG